MSPLQELVGLRVSGVETLFDYVQLIFEGARILTINNRVDSSGDLPAVFHSLPGTQLEAVEESPNWIRFRFENGRELTVDMRDEAFSAPEALTLSRPDKPLVVWT